MNPLFAQAVPVALHDCHACVNDTAPVHVPLETVMTLPTFTVPEIAGSTVLIGTIGGDELEAADALLPVFDAVTTADVLAAVGGDEHVARRGCAGDREPHEVVAVTQRCHAYLNVVGLPAQVPFVTVNVPPR